MLNEGETFEGFGTERIEQNEVIRKLEEQAASGAEKKERKQSEREREWIERLVGKYHEDYAKMARDMKLNPMQQTAADIKKRVEKWKATACDMAVGS